jgi:hypothetical protein
MTLMEVELPTQTLIVMLASREAYFKGMQMAEIWPVYEGKEPTRCPCRKPDPLTNEAESDDAAAR